MFSSARVRFLLRGRSIALALALAPGVAGVAKADVLVDAGRGPVLVRTPQGYDGQPAPLLVFLHGWNNDGDGVEEDFGLAPFADQYGFLYATPDALRRFFGIRDWEWDTTCCGGSGNDSAYLRDLIEAVGVALAVDARRVFVGGYSSGGGMAFRMACDHASLVAAVVAVAGSMADPPVCSPDAPVHVLAVHGTDDSFAWYGGGPFLGGTIGAVEAAEYWGAQAGCTFPPEELLSAYDLDAGLPGLETDVLRFAAGCAADGSDELWTIQGGEHDPDWTDEFRVRLFEYLIAHPKPDPAAPLTDFCHGDGSDVACPCANHGAPGHGCDNSFATGGARLIASEAPSAGLLLVGVSLPPGAPTVLALRSAAGPRIVVSVFGDGFLCLGLPIARLQAASAADGSVRITVGHSVAPGSYDYQLWYRNTADFCTADGFNLSNAVRHFWP